MLKKSIASMCFTVAALIVLNSSVHAAELIVSAAASLTNAFEEMKNGYEKSHPDTTLVLNFGASGALLKQIEAGAPADVFVSADQETMDKAVHAISTPSRINIAANSLVLIVPTKDSVPVTALQDLHGEKIVHIALGNPDSVPAGRYAKAVLTHAGLFETLSPKFVLAENVRQALDYVTRGEVQAGFVFATDAVGRTDKVKVAMEVTEHAPIIYPAAMVAASQNKDAATAFLKYLQSADAQAVLAKYGFKKP